MPLSKGPFSANIHPFIPKLSVPIPHACAFEQKWGDSPEMHGLGPKIHLKTPLAPQPVPLILDSMLRYKGPFSANIHPIIPKRFVPIPQDMCFRPILGALFENARFGAQKSIWNHPLHPSRYHWNLIQCHILRAHSSRIYIQSFPNFLCPYLRAYTFGKWWRASSENARDGAQIHLKSPLAPEPLPLKLDSMPPSKGPFSANIHPIIPKLSVPIPQGMCFRIR